MERQPELTHCPHCGTKLLRTTWGNLICPNCGKVNGKEESSEKKVDYIG